MSESGSIFVTVAPREIEKTLTKLWREEGSPNAIRGNLFTLIIITKDEKKQNYFESLTQAFTKRFPCRMIFVRGKEGLKKRHVQVASVVIESEMGAIASDKITIECGTEELEQIPFLIYPHLLPDLPTYLFWGLAPLEQHLILSHLKRICTRVIFDAECAKNLERFAESMLLQLMHSDASLMDVTWALISGWRHLFYRLYEHDKARAVLQNLLSIEITYNKKKLHHIERIETQACYLLSWLASSLKVSFLKKEGGLFQFKGLKARINSEEVSSLPPGKLLSVLFMGKEGSSLRITHKTEDPKAKIEIEEKTTCHMPFYVSIGDYQRTFSFAKEIFYNSVSCHYEKTLKTLSSITWENT